MARSYKKTLGWLDGGHAYEKRMANKKIRRTPNIPNGVAYRKVTDPWDICDWKYLFWTTREMYRWYVEDFDLNGPCGSFKTREDAIRAMARARCK